MAAYENDSDRTFNKDIAFLMEIQRLEQISNNYAIEGKHAERLRTLRRWSGALSGILTEEQHLKIIKFIKKCQEVRYQDKVYCDVNSLDSLHDYLNKMNTTHKLQLTTKASGADAARID